MQNLSEKRCLICGESDINEFWKDKKKKDGLNIYCKTCVKIAYKKWYKKNIIKIKENKKRYRAKPSTQLLYKEYRKKNHEKALTRNRKWRKNNPDKVREFGRRSYRKNIEKIKQNRLENRIEIRIKHKQWRDANPEKQKIIMQNAHRKIYENEKGKISHRIKKAIRESLKGNKHGRHWEDLVGYSMGDLIKHLKRKIPKGYYWNDYILGKLHLDHKIPISVFNFSKPEHIDFKKCWALSNLQLLSVNDNLEKGSKIEGYFQPSLKL